MLRILWDISFTYENKENWGKSNSSKIEQKKKGKTCDKETMHRFKCRSTLTCNLFTNGLSFTRAIRRYIKKYNVRISKGIHQLIV